MEDLLSRIYNHHRLQTYIYHLKHRYISHFCTTRDTVLLQQCSKVGVCASGKVVRDIVIHLVHRDAGGVRTRARRFCAGACVS
jgi:hypothetical protein